MGDGERTGWSDDELTELFAGARVLGRDAAAAHAPVPAHLELLPAPDGLIWFESTSEIFFDDRVAVVHAWSDAIARPGVPVEVTIRRATDGSWFSERVTMLNLLEHPVGVVLVGVRRLGAVEPPVRTDSEPMDGFPEVARVRRPTWVLQRLDALGTVLSSEGDVEEIFGVRPEALDGRLVLEVIHPGDHAICLDMWTDLLTHPGSLRHLTQRVIRPDGSVCWIECNVINHLGEGDSGSVMSVIHDVTERRGQERDLLTRARSDALTGLPNRSAFIGELQRRLDDPPVTVGFVDLDGFKTVNDRHGHLVGDAVLDIVARRLAGALPAPAVVGRWGGDEFVVLCPERSAEEVVAAVHRTLSDPIAVHEVVWLASASVGVVVGVDGDDPEQLIRSADEAMYLEKQGKRH